eukprot:1328707-Prymnesium_polylepis.1
MAQRSRRRQWYRARRPKRRPRGAPHLAPAAVGRPLRGRHPARIGRRGGSASAFGAAAGLTSGS